MAFFRRGVTHWQNRTKKFGPIWIFLWVTAESGASSPFPQGLPVAVTRPPKGLCVVISASCCAYRRRQSLPPSEIHPKEPERTSFCGTAPGPPLHWSDCP